jgi:DNA-binding XRE family transcriptional regulator
MEHKRTTSHRQRTVEQTAKLRATRERFQKDRPSLDELKSSGDYEIVKQGEYLSLLEFVAGLKQFRQGKGLSLADVADRSGIDKAALSRIENGLNPNPTFATLETIARAMGAGVRYVIEERA